MTRDEILNMPAGRELDALVVTQVLRWELFEDNSFSTPKTIARTVIEDLFMWWNHPNVSSGDTPFSPSTNIADAWRVVEQEPALGLWYVTQDWDDGNEKYNAGMLMDQCIMADAYAETAPLAICRSALLAVMEETEQ